MELAQYAKRQFPDLNVVMVSGQGAPFVPQDTHFLMKPYLPVGGVYDVLQEGIRLRSDQAVVNKGTHTCPPKATIQCVH